MRLTVRGHSSACGDLRQWTPEHGGKPFYERLHINQHGSISARQASAAEGDDRETTELQRGCLHRVYVELCWPTTPNI